MIRELKQQRSLLKEVDLAQRIASKSSHFTSVKRTRRTPLYLSEDVYEIQHRQRQTIRMHRFCVFLFNVASFWILTVLPCHVNVVAFSAQPSSSSYPVDQSTTCQNQNQYPDVHSNSNSNDTPSSSSFVHTLVLCRHGDSIWNGGEPGTKETFTGWTNVPLSQKGILEAKATARQVAALCDEGIDVCATSILQRAQMTAHYCLWGFQEKPNHLSPRKYLQDYRLNERHYGALQGYIKEDVEQGLYGHDPTLVQQWRRCWYSVPPLLDDHDPRRVEELQRYANYCRSDDAGQMQRPEDLVPRGESLEQVAKNRITPFLEDTLCPLLHEAATSRLTSSVSLPFADGSDLLSSNPGGTALVVAHANSLRALIGVLCDVKNDPIALSKLEALRLQTGVPLVLRFRYSVIVEEDERLSRIDYHPCNLDGIPFVNHAFETHLRLNPTQHHHSEQLVPELPVYPLSSIPMHRNQQQ